MAEEDPWGFDDGGDADFTAEATPAASGDVAATGDVVAATGGETRPEMDVTSMDESSYRKPITLYKHWVRCVHLGLEY